MPLNNEIENEINAGHLKKLWTTSDLVDNEVLTRKYSDTYLRSEPANQSISAPGQQLKDGHNVVKY